MAAFVQKNPWTILVAGALIQILTGIPGAWGVFRGPVMDTYALDADAAEQIFTFLLGAVGLGGVIGGYFQDRHGCRAAGLVGTALLALGFCLAGWVPTGAAPLFYLGFSLPVGMGFSFLFPAVMTCAQKWYQGRKGLAAGVIGGAVGASGGVLTLLVRYFTRLWGIRGCFWALGGLLALVCGGGSLLLLEPPPAKALPQDQGKKSPHTPDLTPAQILRTRPFWLGFASACFAAPTVQLFSPIILELARQRGMGEAAIWCIVLGSAGSAGGRLAAPAVSDRLGRRTTDLWLFAGLLGFSALFWPAQGWWVAVVYVCLCFCYAGQAAVLPVLCSDLFGLAHTGVNYGFMALSMSLGSLGFPLLARTLDLEAGRHFLAMGAAAAGFLCLWLLRPHPDQRS